MALVHSFTHFTQTDIFLTAAEKKGWNIQVLSKNPYPLAEISKNALYYRIFSETLSLNISTSSTISRNKYVTQLMFQKFLPEYATDAQIFFIDKLSDTEIQQLLKKHHRLVVKPVDGNNGVGVSTNLQTIDQVRAAIETVRQLHTNLVLIENHIDTTSEYRIILWKGQILDVLERIPAYIIGDGQHSVQELIDQKNQYRQSHFDIAFSPIDIDHNVFFTLNQNGFTLGTILKKNQRLQLKPTCNFSRGGEVKRVPIHTIHPKYIQAFLKIYQITWQTYTGVDLITPDISKTPVLGKTVINELNSGPQPDLTFYDDLIQGTPFEGMYHILEKMEIDPVKAAPDEFIGLKQ